MSADPIFGPLELASARAGGVVLAASDDFFAEKENLIKAAEPVFIADRYTGRGKWMDGWESRRRRVPGNDWAVVRLGIPGVISSVTVDTRFFTGNYPEECSLEGCAADIDARLEELGDWIDLVPRRALRGDSLNLFDVTHPRRSTHVRLNIFPDGGVARLRVYGEARPDWKHLGRDIDLAAAECGATLVDASDRHYGNPQNLIMPGPGCSMADGWETRRRRGPGHDWVTVRLASEGVVEAVEVDTSHFKGNFPHACSLDVSPNGDDGSWTEVLCRSKLEADTRHVFRSELRGGISARFARFNIFPDGGVSRLRLFGRMTELGRTEANLAAWNSASRAQALEDFERCSGSPAWAGRMEAGRPYRDLAALEAAAGKAWEQCSRAEWLQAFATHPRIGERGAGKWPAEEQSGAASASTETLAELERLNFQYLQRFGYIFIVCASGKSADEMLEILRSRMRNSPELELRNAANEQRLITQLRLRKLLSA